MDFAHDLHKAHLWNLSSQRKILNNKVKLNIRSRRPTIVSSRSHPFVMWVLVGGSHMVEEVENGP